MESIVVELDMDFSPNVKKQLSIIETDGFDLFLV